MKNYFESPFMGKTLKEQVTNPNIIVGRYSYYSGYYHQHSFDECARYLNPDRADVDKLIIGDFCSIGSGATFMMAGNQGHRKDWISTFPFFYATHFKNVNDAFIRAGDTIIGNDVWIGAEAFIMPGVKIGDGAIIASRALITKHVKPFEIVGGNPAKHIKFRFDDQKINKLMEIKWWDWSEDELSKCMHLLCSGNIDELYEYWSENTSL